MNSQTQGASVSDEIRVAVQAGLPRHASTYELPFPSSSLFTAPDLQELLETRIVPNELFSLLRNGRPAPKEEHASPVEIGFKKEFSALDPVKALEGLTSGFQLLLARADRLWHPIGEVCDRMGTLIGRQTEAFIVVTPAGANGNPWHFDPCDQFVVQTVGERVWAFSDLATSEAAQAGWTSSEDQVERSDVQLDVRTMAFLPRGLAHRASPPERLSIHVTFAIQRSRVRSLASQDNGEKGRDALEDSDEPLADAVRFG